ncbi:MAG: endonuclease/exonuclease/phosphatase family protein [Phycisphaerales bacterium JB054]
MSTDDPHANKDAAGPTPLARAVRRLALGGVLAGYLGFGLVTLYRADPSDGMGGGETLLAWLSLLGTTFLPHASVGLVVGLVVCALLRARAALIAGVPLLAMSAGPWLVSFAPPPAAGVASADGSILVMSANLLGTSRSDEEVLAQIDAYKPDVIVFQEVRPGSLARLTSALGDRYGSAAAPREHLFGAATFSRLPFSRKTEVVMPGDGSDLPQLMSWVDWGGQELCVWNIHLHSPVGRSQVAGQARLSWEMGHTLDSRAAEGVPTIVAGDFNSPWRAMPLDELRDRGYREAHRVVGAGPGATWPARGLLSLPPGIRIDHAAFSPGLVCVEAWVGEATSSDHRPIFARFVRE